ncbi:hypothetical protein [Chitinophaga barathri]|uniref:Uncharacterized protein n=1 Tax=Chitinophaga barathri TaxID=1647451 RepID=A0A3N4M786_9BACT|nr:hypothetical protein [Chitinophaga barathri]RPD39314.1 hypothetical protein EG028_19500 [Chitinophaga barathri]
MKSYNNLPNREKGYFLHRWFPQHMPALVRFLTDMVVTIRERPESTHTEFPPSFSYDDFLEALNLANERLAEADQLAAKATFFAKYLFGRNIDAVMIYCLLQYVTVIQHPDRKFTEAVIFLFEH